MIKVGEQLRVIIDTIGVPGQGGGAVVAELLRSLPVARPEWTFGVCLMKREARDYDTPMTGDRLQILDDQRDGRYLNRLLWLLRDLPNLIKLWHPDVILSLSNLLPVHSKVKKAVLVHQANILPGARLAEKTSLRSRLRYMILRKAVHASMKAASAIVVQTQPMCEGLIRLDCRLANRIHVIPNGFRDDLYDWTVGSHLQEQMLLHSGVKIFSYVAYPRSHKNYLRLLQAWRQVCKVLPDWRLALTLSPDEDYDGLGSDVGSLFRYIAENNLESSLILLGTLNPREVDYVLRCSEVMVFPSLSESFGLPLVEAMHANCPIIASDLPFAHEIVGPGAVYFNPQSEASIADSLLRVARDEALRHCLRQEGAARLSMYDYRNIADQYCKMLERVCC